MEDGTERLRVNESPELQTEAWTMPDQPNKAPVRSTGGEYLSAIFLESGGLAVVTPIQNGPAKRRGFTFWTQVRRNRVAESATVSRQCCTERDLVIARSDGKKRIFENYGLSDFHLTALARRDIPSDRQSSRG